MEEGKSKSTATTKVKTATPTPKIKPNGKITTVTAPTAHANKRTLESKPARNQLLIDEPSTRESQLNDVPAQKATETKNALPSTKTARKSKSLTGKKIPVALAQNQALIDKTNTGESQFDNVLAAKEMPTSKPKTAIPTTKYGRKSSSVTGKKISAVPAQKQAMMDEQDTEESPSNNVTLEKKTPTSKSIIATTKAKSAGKSAPVTGKKIPTTLSQKQAFTGKPDTEEKSSNDVALEKETPASKPKTATPTTKSVRKSSPVTSSKIPATLAQKQAFIGKPDTEECPPEDVTASKETPTFGRAGRAATLKSRNNDSPTTNTLKSVNVSSAKGRGVKSRAKNVKNVEGSEKVTESEHTKSSSTNAEKKTKGKT